VLTERGLSSALQVLTARIPIPVTLEVAIPARLPEQIEAAAYYVVSEGLANVVKHANAESALVRAEQHDGQIVIEVADDGVGGADPRGGSGLGGLRDRVEALDGDLVVESDADGTVVRVELPLVVRRHRTNVGA